MLNNSGLIKLDLLSKGVTFAADALEEIGIKYTEKRYMYGYSDAARFSERRFPAELILPDDVIAAVHTRSASPWRVVVDDSSFQLSHNGKRICAVSLPARPPFYGIRLKNGVSSEEVATMYGVHVLAYFVRGRCQFFDKGMQCKFCSLNPTRKIAYDAVMQLDPSLVAETAQLAFKCYAEEITYVMYSGGACWDHDIEVQEYLDIMRTVNERVKIPKHVRQHILSMPPHDLSLLDELKDAGVDDCAFALEVWDPDLFKTICPGKHKTYGRKKYLEALEYAVKVFGRGCVYCVFVGGLEPLESLLNGFNQLASMGVTPSVNVFHPDRGAIYSARPAPPPDYLLEMAREQRRNYLKHGFKPSIFGCARSSLDAEAFRGYFG